MKVRKRKMTDEKIAEEISKETLENLKDNKGEE